jgi:hypothetical protein
MIDTPSFFAARATLAAAGISVIVNCVTETMTATGYTQPLVLADVLRLARKQQNGIGG